MEHEFKENSTVKSQQELILYEKIRELKQELTKKDQENCTIFHDFNQKLKNNQDKYLLELTAIRDFYEDSLQQFQNKSIKKEERLQEINLIQEDLILQNNLKSKTIEGLDVKLLELEQDKIKITQSSNLLIKDLETRIEKMLENEKCLNNQLKHVGEEFQRRDNVCLLKFIERITEKQSKSWTKL